MENLITIEASTRSEPGKKLNKSLRRSGRIPAVIYGLKEEAKPVSVSLSDIKKVMKSEGRENSILRIVQDGKHNLDAMIKELQYDYLQNNVIHVDFIRIDLNKPVEVEVPVILEGEPIGVKTEDGLLDFVNREILVRCLPTQIPRMFKVDVSHLHINQSLKLDELPKNEGVQFLSPPTTVVCSVVARAKEEVKEVAPAEAIEGAVPAEEGKPVAAPAEEGKPAAAAGAKPSAPGAKPAAAKAPAGKKEKEG